MWHSHANNKSRIEPACANSQAECCHSKLQAPRIGARPLANDRPQKVIIENATVQKERVDMYCRIHKAMSLLAAWALCIFPATSAVAADETDFSTKTPIKHVVVIFQENVSFDHYFATYPHATNPGPEPQFHAKDDTPRVNNLLAAGLLTENPNSTQPFRLDRTQALTCDQVQNYNDEQKAFDRGLMDKFPESVGTAASGTPPCVDAGKGKGIVMGYYDGNTVTAFWNYAQHFAMSDNSYDTNFGPSSPGAINLVSGQTNGVTSNMAPGGATIPDGGGGLTLISDADPMGDVCSTTSGELVHASGKNIGDLLNAAKVSWGFFEGGFDLTVVNSNGTTGCKRSTTSKVTNVNKTDYIQHHQPFQYYTSTQTLTPARPKSVRTIGQTGGGANHQYDSHGLLNAGLAANF